jgi:hypothetical protein
MVAGVVGAINNTGVGTKIVDTSELVVGSNTVERQNIVISNPGNPTAFATNFPAGMLRVTDESSQLFYDSFDSSVIDVTTRWVGPTQGGGGVLAVVTSGAMVLGSGTTANGYSTILSQPIFVLPSPSWLEVTCLIQFEYPVTTNGYRFWGEGTAPGTPTATAPLTDAVGFEIYTDGKMYAVVYTNGTRNVIQDMSTATGNGTQPVDALWHRYNVAIKTSHAYWYVDQLDTVAATSTFVTPIVQSLPLRLLAVAGSSAPSSSCVITCTGMSAADTGKNNKTISDGTYAFRKVQVGASGGLSIKGASVTGLSFAWAATVTGVSSALAVNEAGNVTFILKNTIPATVFTGSPVIAFQQSDDNVSWGPLNVVRSDTMAAAVSFTITPLVASGSLMFDAALEGVNWIRCSVTTGTTTGGITIVIAPGGLPFSPSISIGGPLPVGTNAIGSVTVASGTVTTVSTVSAARVVGNAGSTLDNTINGAASTNALWTSHAPSTAAATACLASISTAATSGIIKSSAGTLYGFSLANGAAVQYLQIYNLAAGSTGTASIVLTFAVASGAILTIPTGVFGLINNATGISWGVTTTAAGGTAGTAALSMCGFYK